jgi:intein/homing endonuclease
VGIFSRDTTPTPQEPKSKALVASSNSTSSVFLSDKAQSAPYSAPRVLTAAAAQIKIKDTNEFEQFKARRSAASSAWQSEAWEYYDAIGEIKYAFNLVASVVSRIRIYAAAVDDPSETPTPVSKADTISPRLAEAAERALDRLNSAYGGQAGLLRDAALNLSVTGEALDVDTIIPTPTGMRRMGDICTGDTVFDGDGHPTQVVLAHPVLYNRPTYRVEFDSGTSIVADENHLWEVYPVSKRRWSHKSGTPLTPVVLTTKEMSESVRKYNNTSNYAIKRSITQQTHTDLLPIDPYILGYWLGDGWSSQGAITSHPDDQPSLQSELSRGGYTSAIRKSGGGYQLAVYGLKADLRDLDVLNNKHIPEEYFHASIDARLALLQGLVDSDGHVYGNGQVEFSNKNPKILQAFVRLTSSLGLKPGPVRLRKDGTSRVHVRAAGLPLARLPRKAAKLGTQTERDRWDYIRSIESVESRPVRCISVASSNHTFLATDNHIRTHNCYLVQIPERQGTGSPESWDIRSTDELITDARGNFSVIGRREQNSSGGAGTGSMNRGVSLGERSFVGRIWRSHPRFSDEADSSLRGLLDLCLAEGTLVYTPKGAIPIEKISAGDLVYSRNPNTGELVQSIASRVWSTGEKPVYKVSSRGRTLRATGNHPVLVLQDTNPQTRKGVSANYELKYIRVDELKRGDMLVSFESAQQFSEEMQTLPSGVVINEDVAWFIGQVVGDGHIHKSKYAQDCLNISDFDAKVRTRLEEISTKYWGATHFFHQGGNFRVKSKTLVSDMRSLGLAVYSYEKTVPELIWASPLNIQKEFLDGYFTADGSGGKKSKGYMSYASASVSLVSQVRAMHILHGDRVSSVQTQQRPEVMYIAGNTNPTYGAKPLHRFEVYGSDSNRRGDLPMRRNRSAASALPINQPFVVSSVKSITPDGIATVWDMTVPDTENFVADGLVVHNCAELLLLNRTFRATARSRLNAGALYLPDGLSVAAQGDGDFPLDYDSEIDPVAFTPEEAEDEFEEQLIDAMTTPIRDEESASAVVPLIIRGPAELGDAIKQFKFERSFDPALAQRADRVLERILQGLDVPKDVVTGLANVKYSNALQIDESLYKAHIEPLMLLLVDSLTVVYLRPYLLANGFDPHEVNKLVVWYDPSMVATRNDRAEDANEGFDRRAISYNTWRRAHGFSDADAPDAKELSIRMMFERGMITPEMTEAMMTALAPEIMQGVRDAQQASSIAPVPEEIEQAASGEETPQQEVSPEEESEVRSQLFEPEQPSTEQ